MTHNKVKYPENIPFRKLVYVLDLKIDDLAAELGCSRVWLSRVLAGYEKGSKQIGKLTRIIEKKTGKPISEQLPLN